MMKIRLHKILSQIAGTSYRGSEYSENKKTMIVASHDMTVGGAPLVLLSLLGFLHEEYDCFVIAPNDGEMTKKFVEAGHGVYIANPKAFGCQEFKEVLQSADLYFCNTVVSSYFVSLAYQLETPTIWWIHEDREYFEYYSDYLSVDKCTSSNIRIVAVAKRAAECFSEKFHVPCGLLHLGVKDVGNNVKLREPRAVKFFFPGNFISMKGHDVCVEAIRQLPQEYLERTQFVFAGRRDAAEDYIYQMVKNLENDYSNVVLLGMIRRDEVIEWNKQADCILAPSRIDTLPTTIIEGMMMRNICVTSNAAGISEYMENGISGFVFESEDSSDLAEVIRHIVDHIDELDGVKEKGRQVYLDTFTDTKCVDTIHEIIEEIELKKNEKYPKRIIIIVGYIDILDIFAYQLRDAFVKMGYEVYICDQNNQMESLIGLVRFVTKPVMGMITFNNCGVDLKINPEINFWEQWNIPNINILTDHPFCYHEELIKTPSNGVVICVDRNHMNYVSRFYPEVEICGYLPHGGIEGKERKSIKDRNIDVLYVGGISKKFADKDMPDFETYQDFDAKKLCEDAYRILISDAKKTIEEVVEELLVYQGLNYSDEKLRKIVSELHVIDIFVESYYREKILKAIAEAGINLELYGCGWGECDWINKPNVHYGERISTDEAVDRMSNSKIVLSTMTRFKDGAHDSIFNGMLQGAITMSDTSLYMKEEFDGSKDMILFELDEIDDVPEKILQILNDLELAQSIADNGYKKAKEKHSWLRRAEELERDLLIPLFENR